MTRVTPVRLITLHFRQIGFTEARTFIVLVLHQHLFVKQSS